MTPSTAKLLRTTLRWCFFIWFWDARLEPLLRELLRVLAGTSGGAQ